MNENMIEKRPENWGIVGGGVLGLTLALRLAEQGKKVTVIESGPKTGGLAASWQIGDITWDKHYHVMLLSDSALRKVIEELGLSGECNWVETKTGFFANKKLYSLSNSIDYLRLPALKLVDKVRLAGTIFYASKIKNWRKLEQIPVTDWLRKVSGERVLKNLWTPLLKAKLGKNYEIASAAFLWAVISRLYAARRSGLKKEMFGYVNGGYNTIFERFEKVLADKGVTIKTAHRVHDVEKTSDGLIRIDCEGKHSLYFDQVVMTTPTTHLPRICPGLTRDERRVLSKIKYQGIICASAVLKRPLSPYYLTYITDETIPFTAVVEMSSFVDRKMFNGKSLVYLPKYVDPEDEAFLLSDEQLEQMFLNGLRKMHPDLTADEVIDFQISRVRQVLAIPTIDYSLNVPPMQTSIQHLYLVNSAQIVNGTLNVNETIMLAERAAAELANVPQRETAPLRAQA